MEYTEYVGYVCFWKALNQFLEILVMLKKLSMDVSYLM